MRSRIPVLFLILFALLFMLSGRARSEGESPYRLIGTIDGKNLIGAVLDDGTGKQTLYRLRESLPDGSQIVAVRNDSISVKRSDGSRYDLYTIHDTKPSSMPATPAASVPATRPPAPPAPAVPPVQQALPQNDQERLARENAAAGQEPALQGSVEPGSKGRRRGLGKRRPPRYDERAD